jgi:hypothetical protein
VREAVAVVAVEAPEAAAGEAVAVIAVEVAVAEAAIEDMAATEAADVAKQANIVEK